MAAIDDADKIAQAMEDALLGHKYNVGDVVATQYINRTSRWGCVVDIDSEQSSVRVIYVKWFDDGYIIGYSENNPSLRHVETLEHAEHVHAALSSAH